MPRKSPSKTRDMIIAANWKMYKTIEEAKQFVERLAPLAEGSQAKVYIAPPFTALESAAKLVKERQFPFIIGAQNMNDATEGAFTGEIAAKMLLDVGSQFVILGHSERRHIFNESNSFINKKVKKALAVSLQPILCIGETEAQRQTGDTENVLQEQLEVCLEGIEDPANLVLAYEPVWAIGTGKTAKAEDAENAHQFCRKIIEKLFGKKVASKISILYGGSVKPENAAELMAQSQVDGLLVGGASLSPETFSEIIKNSNKVDV